MSLADAYIDVYANLEPFNRQLGQAQQRAGGGGAPAGAGAGAGGMSAETSKVAADTEKTAANVDKAAAAQDKFNAKANTMRGMRLPGEFAHIEMMMERIGMRTDGWLGQLAHVAAKVIAIGAAIDIGWSVGKAIEQTDTMRNALGRTTELVREQQVAIAARNEKQGEALKEINKEINHRERLLGLTDEQKERMKITFTFEENVNKVRDLGAQAQMKVAKVAALELAEWQLKQEEKTNEKKEKLAEKQEALRTKLAEHAEQERKEKSDKIKFGTLEGASRAAVLEGYKSQFGAPSNMAEEKYTKSIAKDKSDIDKLVSELNKNAVITGSVKDAINTMADKFIETMRNKLVAGYQ